jgi:hypothetical protein
MPLFRTEPELWWRLYL